MITLQSAFAPSHGRSSIFTFHRNTHALHSKLLGYSQKDISVTRARLRYLKNCYNMVNEMRRRLLVAVCAVITLHGTVVGQQLQQSEYLIVTFAGSVPKCDFKARDHYAILRLWNTIPFLVQLFCCN